MNDELKIVCWLWKERMFTRPKPSYTKEHIEVWRNMISRNLSIPHEFVCFTDQPEQVPEGIRYEPIPDETLLNYGGCFVRLQEFSWEVSKIIGDQFVDIDLDCVVTGNLDSLFTRDEPAVFFEVNGARFQGSIWMLQPCALPELWHDFKYQDFVWYKHNRKVQQWINRHALNAGWNVGTDQSWINYKLPYIESHRYGKWTENDGIRIWGKEINKDPESHPDLAHTKIVFFPGASDPMELKNQSSWIRRYYH